MARKKKLTDEKAGEYKYAREDMTVKQLKKHIREKNAEVNALITDYWKRILIDNSERDILIDGRIQQLQRMTNTDMKEGKKIKLDLNSGNKSKLLAQARQLDAFASWTGILDLGERDKETGLTPKGLQSYNTFRDKWQLSKKELPPSKWMDIIDIWSSTGSFKEEFGYEDTESHDSMVGAVTDAILEGTLTPKEITQIMSNMAKENKRRKNKITDTQKVVGRLRKKLRDAAEKKKNK